MSKTFFKVGMCITLIPICDIIHIHMLGGIYMNYYCKDNFINHICKLREQSKLSQTELAKELNILIGNSNKYNDKDNSISLDGDNGRQRISQFEHGKGLTIGLAFAYADYFKVSLDYVLGRIEDYKLEYKSIKEITGLSDEAIQSLENMKFEYIDENKRKEHSKLNPKIQRNHNQQELIYSIIDFALKDIEFWNILLESLERIKIQNNQPKDNINHSLALSIEKYHIVKRFEQMLDSMIEEFCLRRVKLNKLF